jgi:hypothetical protein
MRCGCWRYLSLAAALTAPGLAVRRPGWTLRRPGRRHHHRSTDGGGTTGPSPCGHRRLIPAPALSGFKARRRRRRRHRSALARPLADRRSVEPASRLAAMRPACAGWVACCALVDWLYLVADHAGPGGCVFRAHPDTRACRQPAGQALAMAADCWRRCALLFAPKAANPSPHRGEQPRFSRSWPTMPGGVGELAQRRARAAWDSSAERQLPAARTTIAMTSAAHRAPPCRPISSGALSGRPSSCR